MSKTIKKIKEQVFNLKEYVTDTPVMENKLAYNLSFIIEALEELELKQEEIETRQRKICKHLKDDRGVNFFL